MNRDFELTGYEVGNLTGFQVDDAINKIRQHSQPMETDEMLVALGTMWVKTKQAKLDSTSMEGVIRVYARELSAYPADIVREVLAKWPNHSKWWPAWSELKEEIDWRNKRALMCQALVMKRIGFNG